MFSNSINYFSKSEQTAEVPCQNCGRLVTISLPFIGCVFCSDCIDNDTGWNDGTEGFYEPRRTITDTEHLELLEKGLNRYSDLWRSLAEI